MIGDVAPVSIGVMNNGERIAIGMANGVVIQTTGEEREEENTEQMIDTGRGSLSGLEEDTEILVHNITLTTNASEAPSQSVIVNGNSGGGSDSGGGEGNVVEALVIDVTQLPQGTTIELVNVDFAVIVGLGIRRLRD